MRKSNRNDVERRDWILNDEGLYRWWKSSRLAITPFIRTNRTEIDQIIDKLLGVKHG